MSLDEVLTRLQFLGNPANVEGMKRFGIRARKALGVPTPDLRRLARQIGKRNQALNQRAIQTAKVIQTLHSKSARWIAADALRELTSEAVQKRLRR